MASDCLIHDMNRDTRCCRVCGISRTTIDARRPGKARTTMPDEDDLPPISAQDMLCIDLGTALEAFLKLEPILRAAVNKADLPSVDKAYALLHRTYPLYEKWFAAGPQLNTTTCHTQDDYY